MRIFIDLLFKIKGYSYSHDGYCSGDECEYAEIDDELNVRGIHFSPREFSEFITSAPKFPILSENNDWIQPQVESIRREYEETWDMGRKSGYCAGDEYEKHSGEISVEEITVLRVYSKEDE